MRRSLDRTNASFSAELNEIVRSVGVPGVRSKLVGMAYEIPVTQARAELADLINRVVYGGERVVVTRHGKPLVALVSAADLERLEELPESAEEQVVSSLSSVREVASAPASASASVSRPSTGGPAPRRAPAPVRG